MLSAKLGSHIAVNAASTLQLLILDLDLADLSQKGGVTAVVRPVGIDHADFGNGGVALLADKVVAAERQVIHIHSEAVSLNKCLQRILVHLAEAVQGLYGGGDIILCRQRLGLVQGCLAALHGVDDVLFDGSDLRFMQSAVQQVHLSRAYRGTVAAGNDLHALRRAIRSLVILTGQILHGKDSRTVCINGIRHVVQLRLREHGLRCICKQLLGGVLHVIAVDHAHALQGVNAQKRIDLFTKGRSLVVKSLLFLNVNSKNHAVLLSPWLPARADQCHGAYTHSQIRPYPQCGMHAPPRQPAYPPPLPRPALCRLR